VDLHQAFRILTPGPDGRILLGEPPLAFHAHPLDEFDAARSSLSEASSILDLLLAPQTMGEIPVPAWSACFLWGLAGFCLSGTDGDAPEIHPGTGCLYLRRNRTSRIDLVAGPDGFQGVLFLGASSSRGTGLE
jgi:hypothetical protein